MRHIERAPDDGFESELAPGLRSTADAERLADELAFSEARLEQLTVDPPGLYAEVAMATDVEEACWLAFLIAFLSPLEGPEPFAAIAAAHVPWTAGGPTDLGDVRRGPRAPRDAATMAAYRAWAERAGSQREGLLGDPEWERERRFARTFERLALPGFERAARFELLTSLGALDVVPLAAGTLALAAAAPGDGVVLAAKRVLGIGDAISLERRAAALAGGAGLPLAALDLALHNWSATDPERATMGASVAADPDRRDEIAAAIGIP